MNTTRSLPAQPDHTNRLATIRRLYFYLIAFISLMVGLVATSSLLDILIDVWQGSTALVTVNSAGFVRNSVARNGGLLLVATPVFLIHWAYINRIARAATTESLNERHSVLRKLFLYLVAGVTLAVAMVNASTLLQEAVAVLLGQAPLGLVQWPADWITNALNIAIYLSVLRYFLGEARLDGDLGIEEDLAGTMRRLFQTIFGLVGLGLLLSGAGVILERFLRLLIESFTQIALAQLGGEWWIEGVAYGTAWLLVGGLLWRVNWLRWDGLIALHDEEARTALRRFYLYAATVLSAAVALVPAAGLLRHLLLQLFGVALSTELADLAGPLSMLPVGILAWRWHWLQVQGEANRYGDTPESATMRRLYYYLVAAVGLILLWFGLVEILRALLDMLIVGFQNISLSFHAEQVASGVSLLAVGAPVWALHWRTVQRVAGQGGAAAQAERSSGPRRAYLYGVALAGALLILFDLATVIYRMLLLALGEPNADPFGSDTLDALVRSGAAAIFWAVHVLAIRQDTRLTQVTGDVGPPAEELTARRATVETRIRHLEEELAAARAELDLLKRSSTD